MEKTVSKGALFGVTLSVDDAQIKRMKAAPEYCQDTMESVAFYWHSGILPEHFTRAAHGKYGFADRGGRYKRNKGGNPDLVRTGSMKAELLAKAAARKKGKTGGVELKMQARAMNFVPNSANPFDVYVKNRQGKNYPNMRREIRAITDQEVDEMTKIAQTKLAALFSGE